MTSYRVLIDKLEDFFDGQLQVQKFGSDFEEQLPNFATKNEKYPIVFASPVGGTFGDDINTLSVEIRCLDIIQKDRANITTILSDTNQILNDVYLELNTGTDLSCDIASATMTPLNNDLLDYCAGWVLTLEIEVETYCVTEIPN